LLVAAMAHAEAGAEPVAVAMTGGHGEWFVSRFAADAIPTGSPASLRPELAANTCPELLVAGNQARALVTARGFGRALEIWPDARAFAQLSPNALLDDPAPIYGRAPDAKASAA
jgi:tRNA A37 threonylcarbamoyladenosine modification protein TsaB